MVVIMGVVVNPIVAITKNTTVNQKPIRENAQKQTGRKNLLLKMNPTVKEKKQKRKMQKKQFQQNLLKDS